MPFGFKKAPSTFQWAMDVALSEDRSQLTLVFFEITVLLSPSVRDRINPSLCVLALLRGDEAIVKLEKSENCQKQWPAWINLFL